MNDVVREAIDLAHSNLIARKVKVIQQLQPELVLVNGDRVQLQQVLLNLIVNACDAMSNTPPESRRLTFTTLPAVGRHVQLLVSDTGCGIADDAIDRLFESFFTTKVHGLGFGLSISSAIIAEHGGHIEAMNSPRGGATFCITLPALVVESEVHDEQRSHRISGG
jgi:C4-dicarboxylate-specific signal transduction histidine kinase